MQSKCPHSLDVPPTDCETLLTATRGMAPIAAPTRDDLRTLEHWLSGQLGLGSTISQRFFDSQTQCVANGGRGRRCSLDTWHPAHFKETANFLLVLGRDLRELPQPCADLIRALRKRCFCRSHSEPILELYEAILGLQDDEEDGENAGSGVEIPDSVIDSSHYGEVDDDGAQSDGRSSATHDDSHGGRESSDKDDFEEDGETDNSDTHSSDADDRSDGYSGNDSDIAGEWLLLLGFPPLKTEAPAASQPDEEATINDREDTLIFRWPSPTRRPVCLAESPCPRARISLEIRFEQECSEHEACGSRLSLPTRPPPDSHREARNMLLESPQKKWNGPFRG